MQKNDLGPDFVDKLTLFTMRQISRRGFLKISGGAVTLVGTVGAWFGLSGFRDSQRGPDGQKLHCPPGCVGLCLCLNQSFCQLSGVRCLCPLGACDRGVYYQAYGYYNLDTCEPLCGCGRC